jgi:hypothetical protein
MFRWLPSMQACTCLTIFSLVLSLLAGKVYGAQQEQLIPLLGVTTGKSDRIKQA